MVSAKSLGLENWFGYHPIAWKNLAYAEQAESSLGVLSKGQVQLVLRDLDGKLLVKLAGPIDAVNALHREVEKRSLAGLLLGMGPA